MTLAKVKEQDGMTLAKVKEQDGMTACKSKGTRWDDSCKSRGTRWDSTCKSKSPKYHYISGLNRRGRSLMKQLTVVKGCLEGCIGRGFRICCRS